ncbi:MAG: hypothetical protein WA706_19695, partial [Pseudolabrys sp.]
AKGGDPVQALGRPPYCGSSTGKPFGYGDASRWRCIVFPRRVHFGPTGDDLDRSGDEQSGDNDHGEYVTHGNPPLHLLKIMPIAPKFCDGHHKIPLFWTYT